MNQILNNKNKHFYDEVIPYIISGYPSLIEFCYDKMQNQKPIAEKLYESYKPEGKQYVEIDYTDIQLQKVYLMRYFILHALLVPFVLDTLLTRNNDDLLYTTCLKLLRSNALNVSLFGGGPSPELYGLAHYLKKRQSNPGISSRVLDKTNWQIRWEIDRTNWQICWRIDMKPRAHFLKTNLMAPLDQDAVDWVGRSDLVVIQNCLNEIPCSDDNYNPQLLKNMEHIVKLLKPGSLMLVIDRVGYKLVDNLLCDFRCNLEALNNLKILYGSDDLNISGLCLPYSSGSSHNNTSMALPFSEPNIRLFPDTRCPPGDFEMSTEPNKMIKELSKKWLFNNKIRFQWLAVSKNYYYSLDSIHA